MIRYNFSGYFCEPGSTSSRAAACGGITKYCPQGSELPITVLPGWYTVGGDIWTRIDQKRCPPGSYCINGERKLCPEGMCKNNNDQWLNIIT